MTKLKLKRPFVVFDLETTGVDVIKDRIIQISCTKIDPNGETKTKNVYLNPTIPIPEGATEVHGITDEEVKDAPLFKNIAKSLFKFMHDSDLCGYNSDHFDVLLLSEEFARVGLKWPEEGVVMVDVMKIESKVNPRTLSAVYERYFDDSFSDAHDAAADVSATIDVLFEQISRHDLPCDVSELEKLCAGDKERIDLDWKLYRKDGVAYYGFGKHANSPMKDHPGFGKWMLDQNFITGNTKDCVRKELGL